MNITVVVVKIMPTFTFATENKRHFTSRILIEPIDKQNLILRH